MIRNLARQPAEISLYWEQARCFSCLRQAAFARASNASNQGAIVTIHTLRSVYNEV